MRKIIFGILAVVWMTIIFVFSSRNADESTEDSHDIGYAVGKTVIAAFDTWTPEEQLAFAMKVDHPIRKTAHFIEYMMLGIFITGACYDSVRRRAYNMLIPWVISTLYAASDEIHQLYVEGRSGQLTDVILDSAGAMSGVLLCILVLSVHRHLALGQQRKNKIEHQKV